jgi:rhodanese-related sulfurtransferase
MATSVSELILAAKARIRNLSVEEFERAILQDAVIIDLREPNEIAEHGKIPGSVEIPRVMLELTADPSTRYFNPVFRRDAPILLYCAAGSRSSPRCGNLAGDGL